jgi:cytochrome c2
MFTVMREKGLEPPQFADADLPDLLAFLYAVNYFGEPGDPAAGQRHFQDKSCVRCHVVGERDPKGKVPMDRFAGARSPIFLAQAMWNAAPKIRDALAQLDVPPPTFEGSEMADILAWIRSEALDGCRTPMFVAPGDPVRGARLFDEKSCSKCHSVAGPSPGPGKCLRYDAAKRSVIELAGIFWNHSFEMRAEMVTRGIGPVSFSPQEMADLIAFLYYVPYTDLDGNVEQGRALFVGKGCETCHEANDVVERAASLREKAPSSRGEFAGTLLTQMWNHAPKMEKVALEREVPWPRFEGDEMRDLLAYLLSLSPWALRPGGPSKEEGFHRLPGDQKPRPEDGLAGASLRGTVFPKTHDTHSLVRSKYVQLEETRLTRCHGSWQPQLLGKEKDR